MRALAYPVAAAVLAVLLTGALAAQQPVPSQRSVSSGSGGVTVAQIEKPSTDSWPTYNGDYTGRRFSSLTKINASNVKHLSLSWIYDLPAAGTIKATPLQIGGVLYFTTPNHVYAVDARTGRELWHYTFARSRGGIQIGNRGIAALGNTVYFVTTDCNLVALDIKTGTEKWAKEFCSLEMMYYGSIAPVVVKDKLILGPSGDDLDVPAYLDARSPENGELIWRWYVTPQNEGEAGLDTWPNLDMAKHGGGMTWQPITYDPELNHIYVTTGNPQPVVAFKNREGANLFTASIVALNADTGKMVWYFQSSPHDTHDWDATQTAVVFDGTIDGKPRKLLAQASRNGQFFVLDRTNGKAIVSNEYIKTNWSLDYDARGQPIPEPGETSADRRSARDAEPGWRDQLVPAELQSADRPVLRERDACVQRVVHLRPQRQSDGLGRHRPRRLRRTTAAESDRLQDRQNPLERAAIWRQLGHSHHRGQRPVQRGGRGDRSLQRHHRGGALERTSRQFRDQRSDHLRARRPAVRDCRRRLAAGCLCPESVSVSNARHQEGAR
jgi:PQQ-dependent dehydrogenase (methanol/ethanol family)